MKNINITGWTLQTCIGIKNLIRNILREAYYLIILFIHNWSNIQLILLKHDDPFAVIY